ncbi:A/G-specific adenine glycosylase [Candidatus Puniceispirillum sp.]|uniref:A/G-specific adenine glycosylase n=1 Tax=Candidatus Puniceispirillum sp. TaxID=2026719 RepID=UPI001ECCBC87|nr:A/G-specific adenine glycosylase [Candidatus Puniceispirillum sp.]
MLDKRAEAQTVGHDIGTDSRKSVKARQNNTAFDSVALFAWYDRHGRNLPWRHRWPDLAPAYHVWLSEIMLQQTVVATVIPYFLEFTRRWPDVTALAKAPLDDVLAAWAGLGYYARARNLHKAALKVAFEHGGIFPRDEVGLRDLPGIGPYTAGAIRAIAFGQKATVVDGNIERVLARQYAVTTPLPAAKAEIGTIYAAICPDQRPSDFPQALMDFANAVCTVKAPGCASCPLAMSCVAGRNGTAANFPVKAAKKPKPARRGMAFVAFDAEGRCLLVKRPDKGLLGGMLAFPSVGWDQRAPDKLASLDDAPFAADWVILDDPVQHVFTHFMLDMQVAVTRLDAGVYPDVPDYSGANWVTPRAADLPSLMRKVLKAVQANRP